jgi:hypothetical protein
VTSSDLNGRTVAVDGWHLADSFLIIIIVAFIVAVVVVVIVAVADSSDLVGFLIKCLAATCNASSACPRMAFLSGIPGWDTKTEEAF